MKALEKIALASRLLSASGIEDSRREAELIVSYVLDKKREDLYRDDPDLPDEVLKSVDTFVNRRSNREPLQYILGFVEFCGLQIRVGPGVLIPRPETELLVEEAVAVIPDLKTQNSKLKILDLCTGSGCIALAMAREFPGSSIWGTDASGKALGYARKNAQINGIANADFLEGDLFEPVEREIKKGRGAFHFDMILSNPPYVPKKEIEELQPEVREWEPEAALDGGEDGLDYYRRIIPGATEYLRKGGALLFEMGIGQGGAIRTIAEKNGFCEISIVKDYAGIERIFKGIYSGG